MSRVQKMQTQPLALIFKFLQTKQRVQLWLYEHAETRLEGKIIGFDEFMNVVLDETDELDMKKRTRKTIGRLLLKGDNITLIQAAPQTVATDASAAIAATS